MFLRKKQTIKFKHSYQKYSKYSYISTGFIILIFKYNTNLYNINTGNCYVSLTTVIVKFVCQSITTCLQLRRVPDCKLVTVTR